MNTSPVLLKKVFGYLRGELKKLKEPTKIREQYVLLQINQICHVAESILILQANRKMDAAGCLVRPLVEGFLHLKASLKEPSYAAAKSASDMRKSIDQLARLEKNCPPGPAKDQFVSLIAANEKILSGFKIKHSVTDQRWNNYQVAELAECVQLYENAYSFFHPSVHAAIDGIMPLKSNLFENLVFDIVTPVMVDTTATTLNQFLPERASDFEEKMKGWQDHPDGGGGGSKARTIVTLVFFLVISTMALVACFSRASTRWLSLSKIMERGWEKEL